MCEKSGSDKIWQHNISIVLNSVFGMNVASAFNLMMIDNILVEFIFIIKCYDMKILINLSIGLLAYVNLELRI